MAEVTTKTATTAVVLSGGGARGAYEAGVIGGIVEILQGRGLTRAPFSIFTGTSVGAINAAWLAAHADIPDMNVSGLLDQWRNLTLREHLRISPMRFLRPSRGGERLGRSFIDPRALEGLVRTEIPFTHLHRCGLLLRWGNSIQHTACSGNPVRGYSPRRRIGVVSRRGRRC